MTYDWPLAVDGNMHYICKASHDWEIFYLGQDMDYLQYGRIPDNALLHYQNHKKWTNDAINWLKQLIDYQMHYPDDVLPIHIYTWHHQNR